MREGGRRRGEEAVARPARKAAAFAFPATAPTTFPRSDARRLVVVTRVCALRAASGSVVLRAREAQCRGTRRGAQKQRKGRVAATGVLGRALLSVPDFHIAPG